MEQQELPGIGETPSLFFSAIHLNFLRPVLRGEGQSTGCKTALSERVA
jgi:hypothetical protein